MENDISYHSLKIPKEEREWLRVIFNSLMAEFSVNGIELAMELAWKRGYSRK